jgi:hypothetical protein
VIIIKVKFIGNAIPSTIIKQGIFRERIKSEKGGKMELNLHNPCFRIELSLCCATKGSKLDLQRIS